MSSDLLQQDEHEQGWVPTVRSLLRDWQPTFEEAVAIAPEVWEPQDGSPTMEGTTSLEGMVVSLAASLPVIAARILDEWFREKNDPASEKAVRQFFACELRKALDERSKATFAKMQSAGFELQDQHPALPWLPFSETFVESLVSSTSKLVHGSNLIELDGS